MSIRRTRRERITRAKLETIATYLGKDSVAAAALRKVREMASLDVRADIFRTPEGFHVQTVASCFRFN